VVKKQFRVFSFGLKLALTLGVAATLGCGAHVPDEADAEPVQQSQQGIIPGSAVTQTFRLIPVPAGATLVNQQVNCPAGSVVVGGGYLSAPNTRVYTSVLNGNGWSVSLQNLSNTHSYTLNLVAECLSGTNATSGLAAPATVLLSAGGSGCVPTAGCAAGKLLVGGGYTAPSSFRASESQLFTDGRWKVCGWNENTGSSIMVFTYPVCLSGVSGSTLRKFTPGPLLPPGGDTRVDSQPCAAGLLLGSGGFQVATRSIYTRGSTRSFQDATRWSNTFVNTSLNHLPTGVSTNCLELWQ
jgi:hypothetical protein